MKTERITTIKKRFKSQWLLIDIEKMDESTTTPLTGQLIAHSPKRDKVYKLLLKSPHLKRPMIECTGKVLPKGMAAALMDS